MSVSRILLLAALATSATGASAATVYTDRADFLAAVAGVSTDTFEENGTATYTSHGSTYTGAGFSIQGSSVFTVDPDFDGLYQWNSGDVLDAERGNLTVTAASGVKGLGFDFGNPGNSDYSGTGIITINGTDYVMAGQPTFNFFGIVDDAGLGPIAIDFHGGLGILDNLSVAREAVSGAVPEPASWAMMIGGLAVVGSAMRRRATQVSFA